MAELEELLKLHQRLLLQCWQVRSRLRSAADLRSHGYALAAVARRLQKLFDHHAASLPAPLRQNTIRALAQTRALAHAIGIPTDAAPHLAASPSSQDASPQRNDP